MYNILPRHIKELTPISGNRNTFGENVFSIPYNELAFEQKLKVAVDLVRQSMLYCEIPNPQLEMTTLSGDSYTACCILKEYLIQNNLGVHHIICFVEGKKYEIIGMPSTHFILLVSDYNDNWFQLDPSPMVDYKCGRDACCTQQYVWKYIKNNIDGNMKCSTRDSWKSKYMSNELYTNWLNETESAYNQYHRNTSINGMNVKINIGESTTLNDSNGVLSHYESFSHNINGVTFSHTRK